MENELVQFSPSRGQLLLKLDEFEEDFYGSGIIRPQTAMDKPVVGTVIAIGKPARTRKGNLIPYSVTVGQRVAVPWATGVDMSHEGRLHVLCTEEQILGEVVD